MPSEYLLLEPLELLGSVGQVPIFKTAPDWIETMSTSDQKLLLPIFWGACKIEKAFSQLFKSHTAF